MEGPLSLVVLYLLSNFFFGEGFGFEKMPKTWFQIISIEHDEGTDLLD